MKGLWVKDWLLLKAQWLAAAITVVLALGAMALFKRLGVAIGMELAALTMAFVSLATLSADQNNGGIAFLLTLPITAKQYIHEMFALMAVMVAATTAVISLIALGYRQLANWPITVATLLELTSTIGLLTYLMLSVTMSFQLRHGAQQAQVTMSITGGVVAILIGGCLWAVRTTDWGAKLWQDVLIAYTQHGGRVVLLPLIGIVLLATGIGSWYARPLAQK